MRILKRKIELAEGSLMKLSFMRLTKIVDEVRVSISEPKSLRKDNIFIRNIVELYLLKKILLIRLR